MLYKADLHIHTVLSPCGDLDMSPAMIIDQVLIKQLDIIGITDHNSTKNAIIAKEIGVKNNVFVLMGAEVTSKEEVHCLCFMPNEDKLLKFQEYLELHINQKKNKPKFFGNQFVVDSRENILAEEELLLIQSINQDIYQISDKVESLGGIFIPAHVDAHRNSLGSQLSFIPDDLSFDALEIIHKQHMSEHIEKYRIPENTFIISSSDAHYLGDIGKRFTEFDLEELSFEGIKKAMQLNVKS